jgi:intracellular sulfur oxidation DsrE/DsrF family protein
MTTSKTPRRSFLGGLFAATAAAVSLPLTGLRAESAPHQGGTAWMNDVKGTHRCFFDFPQHKNGFPLLHILNYINTYSAAMGAKPGDVGAVGSFYSFGAGASIGMSVDDEMWAKYGLGEYFGLKDANGRAYTRNVFNSPTADDRHLFSQALNSPDLPMFGGAIVAAGIKSLQGMGAKFLLCNNALNGWTFDLEARGKGAQADILKDLTAHVLPGVTIVPAMVIAIEQAQTAGIAYNKQ